MNARPVHPGSAARGFTLVELLVTITIIGILASVVLGALNAARQTARVAKTKSMIARLDHVIMQRYESYRTRRVPISTSGLPAKPAAEFRLEALRDLMRMEMPERWNDVSDAPADFSVDSWSWPQGTLSLKINPDQWKVTLPDGRIVYIPARLRVPGLAQQYRATYDARPPSGANSHAECLYMVVMSGSAEDREKFRDTEIGDTDNDRWPEFVDGWGKPIYFLRWAPGFSSGSQFLRDQGIDFQGTSDIQSGDHVNDHDPFDVRNVDADAFRLVPLIYSSGADEEIGVDAEDDVHFTLPDGPFANLDIGVPDGTGNHHDNIHNHHIEQR